MSDKKIAVFFPGIGYTNDKPLLYYGRKLAAEKHVPLYTYPGCDHSLECNSQKKNIEILGKVMDLTETYMSDKSI